MSEQFSPSGRVVAPIDEDGGDVARSGALDDRHVFSTNEVGQFDRLVLICTVLFDVPMAAISIVDGDRQWFVAKRGFDLEEIRREDAFCNVKNEPSKIFTVESASKDPRFTTNPLVVGYPHVEFYAGFPIEAQVQQIGTICIMDSRPRVLTVEQEVSLQGFALVVQTELGREQGRRRAAEVHRALLPIPMTSVPGYQVAGVCLPWRVVGGDYYDWTLFDSGDFVVSVADVMGKGIGAAVIMASVRAAFKTLELRTTLAEIVSDVAHALDEDLTRTESFVTVFHALIKPANGAMEYVDAGHGLATILHPDGSFDRLAVRGIPIGVDVDNEWASGFATLNPGDTLLVISDGLWEMLTGDVEARDDLIARTLAQNDLVSALDGLLDKVRLHEASDDITALAVRRDVR